MRRSSSGALAIILAAFVAPAEAPPTTYATQPGSTPREIWDIAMLGTSLRGLSLTLDGDGVEVRPQQPDGTFPTTLLIPRPGAYAHLPVRVATFNTFDDVFVAYLDNGQLCLDQVTLETSPPFNNAHYCQNRASAPAARPHLVARAPSINSSPGDDVAVIAGPTEVMVLVDDGLGRLMPPALLTLTGVTSATAIAAGDVDGDGSDDLFVLDGPSGNVQVLHNDGALSFSLLQTVSLGIATDQVTDMIVEDLDGDTRPDIATVRKATAELAVALHGSGAPYPATLSFAVPGQDPVALTAGLVAPAGGGMDLMVVAQNVPGVYGSAMGFDNDGSGGFTLASQYYIEGTPQSIVTMNLELSANANQESSFSVLRMDGSGNQSSADAFVAGRGAGPPNDTTVRVGHGDGTWVQSADVVAYPGASSGVKVAGADVDGANPLFARDEVLTGPGVTPNLGPHLKAFRRNGLGLASIAKVSFYAYGTLKYGVNPTGADLDGDPFDEIVTGAGPGAVFGPHVRGWNFDGSTLTAMAKVNFFAYGTLKYGVNVAGGDLDGDGFDEILTGPGPSAVFAAQVRAFDVDGGSVSAINKVNFVAFAAASQGAWVGAGDVEGDGYDEIVVGGGPDPATPASIALFDYDGTRVTASAIGPFQLGSGYGARVAAGDVQGKRNGARTIDDVLAASGDDPTAASTIYCLTCLPPVTFGPFPASTYGANPGAAALAF